MRLKTGILYLLLICTVSGTHSQSFSTLGEIYEFNLYDEFHFVNIYCCNDLAFQYKFIKVTEKQYTGNSLFYRFSKSVFDFVNSSPPSLVDTNLYMGVDSLIIANPDSIIFGPEDEILFSDKLYNGRKINIDYNIIFNTIRVCRYTVGCGLTSSGWIQPPSDSCWITDSLVFFKKGNETWGKDLLHSSQEPLKEKFVIYPNPTSSTFIVDFGGLSNQISKTEIYDLLGTKIISFFNWDNSGSKVQFDLEAFPGGTYFIVFTIEDKYYVNRIIRR